MDPVQDPGHGRVLDHNLRLAPGRVLGRSPVHNPVPDQLRGLCRALNLGPLPGLVRAPVRNQVQLLVRVLPRNLDPCLGRNQVPAPVPSRVQCQGHSPGLPQAQFLVRNLGRRPVQLLVLSRVPSRRLARGRALAHNLRLARGRALGRSRRLHPVRNLAPDPLLVRHQFPDQAEARHLVRLPIPCHRLRRVSEDFWPDCRHVREELPRRALRAESFLFLH